MVPVFYRDILAYNGTNTCTGTKLISKSGMFVYIYCSRILLDVLAMAASSISKVTVSSGGMLLSKLDSHDLQSENSRSYDGSFVYAQNKVSCTASIASAVNRLGFSY